MKTVVKTWRNRLPIVSDDLSHWSSIFMWRQHHYQGTDTHGRSPTLCEAFLHFRPATRWRANKQERTHTVAQVTASSREEFSLKDHDVQNPSGSLCISKCQFVRILCLWLQEHTHIYIYLLSARLSPMVTLKLFRGSHCKMWCLKQVGLRLTARGWDNDRTCSAALCQWNPLHLFVTAFKPMLKWNRIFSMKFMATAHLPFSTFSAPSAPLCIITDELLGVLVDRQWL